MFRRWEISALLILSIVATPVTSALSASCKESDQNWRVTNLSKFNKPKYQENISGVACNPMRDKISCIIVQDEDFEAASAILMPGRLDVATTFELPRVVDASGKDEYDAEAVAYDSKQNKWYVLGSHSRRGKRCLEPNPSSRMLAQFDVEPATGAPVNPKPSRPIAEVLQTIPELFAKFDKCLGTKLPDDAVGQWRPDQGINFEGLTVVGDDVFLGLRGPVLSGAAQIVKVKRDALFGGATSKPDRFSLVLSPTGGVRDLAVHGKQVLILSGSEDDDLGNAAIHIWDGASSQARNLCNIPDPEPSSKDKPEALLVLAGTETTVRVLVLSDGPVGGNPREFVIDLR